MLKIVHELNQLDFGGVEKVIRNIIRFDPKNDHAIIAYKDGPYRQKLEDVGARVILIDAADLEADDIDVDADVIHIHCGGAKSNLAQCIGLDFAVIETIHSPVRSPNSNKLISQRVGVSDAVSKMNNKAITIHNGIDFDGIDPKISREEYFSRMGWNPAKKVIGRLGRLGKDKGLEEWILACYYLQQQGYDFMPLIVGSEARDCAGYRGKLKLMCESLPIKGVVWMSNQEYISDVLQCMDVFFYPSATEGFGLVFVEAMHNDCVVVSYDNDVNREIIGGYSVLVPESKGIPGLVDGIKKALAQEVRDEIQGIQDTFIREQYDAQRMSEDYQDLYEKCEKEFNAKVQESIVK